MSSLANKLISGCYVSTEEEMWFDIIISKCYKDTTMFYRPLFVRGKAYWLLEIHCIPSWAVRQVYLGFIPNLRVLIYRERTAS
jgi:hypothetical protein